MITDEVQHRRPTLLAPQRTPTRELQPQRTLTREPATNQVRRISFVSLLPIVPVKTGSERAGVGCVLSLLWLMISSNLKPYAKVRGRVASTSTPRHEPPRHHPPPRTRQDVTNALSEALQYITFFTFFLALAIDLELYDSNATEGVSVLGVVSVVSVMV